MLKKISLLMAVIVMMLPAMYLYGVYQNNRDVPLPEISEMQQQYEQSIQWLVNHEGGILSQNNPMIWWMLYEVQKISPDERIEKLIDTYFERNKQLKLSPWGPLFDGEQHRTLGAYAVVGLPYYNQHFIYALNCGEDIAAELDLVARQNDASFCYQAEYIYRPACITHQLMGINFLNKKQCHLLPDIDQVGLSLREGILTQLTWDIRIVDVYLQRVLMLLITGAEDHVKPVWVQQVLDQQLADGGWGNFDALLAIGGGRSLGFSARLLSLGSEKSSFHATAQGVYILAYLIGKQNNLNNT